MVTQLKLSSQGEFRGAFSLLFDSANPLNRIIRRKGRNAGKAARIRVLFGALTMVYETSMDN